MVAERKFESARLLRRAASLSLVGWAGVALGWQLAPRATFFGYLCAFAVVAAVATGALLFLMTTYVVNASWNVVIRPLNEGIVRAIPLLPLLFIPIYFGLSQLYPWARPALGLEEPERRLFEHKLAYLNPSFFLARSAVYFAVWALAAWLMLRNRPRARTELEPNAERRRWAAALLVPCSFSLTFAAFDWLMSLDPFWSSSIFGVYYFAGGFVASLGLLAMLAERSLRSGALQGAVRPSHFHALGRLMLGFSIFWAYIAFFQALLIRIANRPDEVAFYARRSSHGWDVVLALVVLTRFVLPFFLLLPRRLKFRPTFVAACGGLLLFGEFLDVFWLVVPERLGAQGLPSIWDLAALLALSATTVTFVAWRMRGTPVLPFGDPDLARSVAYRNLQ